MVSIRHRSGSWNVRWREKTPDGRSVMKQETYRDSFQAGERKREIELSRVESRYNNHGNRREVRGGRCR